MDILARPVAVAESLIDNGHGLRFSRVLVGKVASGNKRCPQRPKVVRTHDGTADFHGFVRLGHIPFQLEVISVDAEAEGRKIRQGDGFHARAEPRAWPELPVEGDARIARIAGRRELIGSEQHVVRIETRIRLLRVLQAASEKPGADQQEQREGDLRHHQAARQARFMEPTETLLASSFSTVCTGRLEDRSAGRIPKISAERIEIAVVANKTR